MMRTFQGGILALSAILITGSAVANDAATGRMLFRPFLDVQHIPQDLAGALVTAHPIGLCGPAPVQKLQLSAQFFSACLLPPFQHVFRNVVIFRHRTEHSITAQWQARAGQTNEPRFITKDLA